MSDIDSEKYGNVRFVKVKGQQSLNRIA